MRAQALKLLRVLSEADGIPGNEYEVRSLFHKLLTEVAKAKKGQIAEDKLGSVACIRRGKSDRPRIMLDAHLDEIGFLVHSITSRGFIRVVPLGGWWGHVLLGQRVRINTRKGKIPGVVSSTPVHFLEPEDRNKVIDPLKMRIDVGAGEKAEVEALGITPGCPVIPESAFVELAPEDMVMGKAFDNRVGCALVVQALSALSDHPNTVVGVGSVQEEVGHRGAATSVEVAQPDVALVLEGTPADDTPGLDPEQSQGRLKGGVQIRVSDPSMIGHLGLRTLLEEIAREGKIPYQLAVRHRGGTDGAAIQRHATGVPTVVLSVPVRYVHSHAGILCLGDYLATLALILNFCERFDEEAWKKLRQY